MNAAKYMTKARFADAILWDGRNTKEVCAWCAKKFGGATQDGAYLKVYGGVNSPNFTVCPDQYIIAWEDGTISAQWSTHFERDFTVNPNYIADHSGLPMCSKGTLLCQEGQVSVCYGDPNYRQPHSYTCDLLNNIK